MRKLSIAFLVLFVASCSPGKTSWEEGILSQLTLEEKTDLIHAQSKFSSRGVPRLGIPDVWLSDGPFGVREEILWDSWEKAKWTNDSCTAFPTLTCLAASWNPELSYEYGKALGEEACYRGKNVILGPGVNMFRTPLCGRNFEYMGEDPYLAATMAVPYIRGVQQSNVAACVKHFALNNQEAFRSKINVIVDERALRELYLPAFEAAVREAGVWAVMGSYNRYNGQYCCHNETLNNILKKEWGFDGVVISDWGGTHSTEEAVQNGLDMEFGTGTDGMSEDSRNPYDNYYLAGPYRRMIEKGKIGTRELDDKALRVLRLIRRTSMSGNTSRGSFASPEHYNTCLDIAREGVVLLKNENSLLPLSQGGRILVVGDNASRTLSNAGGSSALKPWKEVLTLDAIRKIAGPDTKVDYCRGYKAYMPGNIPPDADALREEAMRAAREADIVIYIGGMNRWSYQDSEGRDRLDYDLPFGQNLLIDGLLEVNPNVVLVLNGGTAFSMPWARKAPAILYAMYGGSANGQVIAEILFGKTVPSGHLPFTIAEKLEDYPPHANGTYDRDNPGDVNYSEGIFTGYRWMDREGINPMWSFGFGLSYTSFEMGRPIVRHGTMRGTRSEVAPSEAPEQRKGQKIKVKVPVENTGCVRGATVVQLYVGSPHSAVSRPEKELKSFNKVWLEPGEKKMVELEVCEGDLRYFDEEKHSWVLEKGEYLLRFGFSAREIYYAESIFVK